MGEQMSAKISSLFIICVWAATRVHLAPKYVSRKFHSLSLSVKIVIELQIFSEHNVTLFTDNEPKQPDMFSCHFIVIPETEVQCFS